MGSNSGAAPEGAYAAGAFYQGFLEGYNTMDALAGLAFGIIVVNVIRDLGVENPGDVAKNTVRSGILSSVLMAVIYVLVTVVGAQSRGVFPPSSNGGEALALIAGHYFGPAGAVILAAAVTLACLKTAVGLITSCGETFQKIFPKGPSYRIWAVLFSTLSFLIANLGLDAIVSWSKPVLLFLYPLAITLILLTLFGRLFGNDGRVYRWVTGFTAAAAAVDFINALPGQVLSALRLEKTAEAVRDFLPFAENGFGWICPALLGLVIGIFYCAYKKSIYRKTT